MTLTFKKVEELKHLLWKSDLSQDEIARLFNTSQSTVSRINKGQAWPGVAWPDGSTGSNILTSYIRLNTQHPREPSEIAKAAADRLANQENHNG